MGYIRDNIERLKSELPEDVLLVAVSKTESPESIMEAYNAGHRNFGENRVQELIAKQPLLPRDIEWHLIGHLQRNKVKYVVPFVSLIESADSVRLLEAVNKEALKADRKIRVLLQIHIAKEEHKYGFTMEEIEQFFSQGGSPKLSSLIFSGVMGMATFTDDREQIREEFKYLTDCYTNVKNSFFRNDERFREISMGMSGDYAIAVEEGSTIVRIGSSIFGERQ